METFTAFIKTKPLEHPVQLEETVKKWMINQRIIQPEPNQFEPVYYPDIGHAKIAKEESYGTVEFISRRAELIHTLGWDFGLDFILPDLIICPSCNTDTIQGIDPAAFYGERYLEQNPDEIRFLAQLKEAIPSWESGNEVVLKCHLCKNEHLIEHYDYKNSLIFTNFAIIYWNWPALKEEFIKELEEKLGVEVLVKTL